MESEVGLTLLDELRSEQILVHYQRDSAAQTGLVAFVRRAKPGNPDEGIAAHLGLNERAYQIPERRNVADDYDLAWRQSRRDHVQPAT